MVQPFFSSIGAYGERSLVHIAGRLTHAGRLRTAFGEARAVWEEVQVVPTADEEALATRILGCAGARDHLFARVDLVRDDDGRPHLMELELIEPRLFLRFEPEATDRLADALARLVTPAVRARAR